MMALPLQGYVVTCVCLLRYALIVLRADDNGQGGAFALFSLLKRQAELGKKSKVTSLPSQNDNYSASIRVTAWHVDEVELFQCQLAQQSPVVTVFVSWSSEHENACENSHDRCAVMPRDCAI